MIQRQIYFLSDTDEGTWSVRYGTKEKSVWVNDYRAKSRSRFEMQYLLDHVNKQLPNWNRNADNKRKLERNK